MGGQQAAATVEAARHGFNGWRKQAVVKLGKRLRKRFDRIISHYSRIPDVPVFDNAIFPWVADLEAHWRDILAEAELILAERSKVPPLSAISPDHKKIARGEEWKSFFMWAYGYRVDENCARCPATAALVEKVPGLQTAMFSILEPGAHLPPHRGVTKAIFNCHLALKIPGGKEKCWMIVDGVKYGWEEGKLLAFDDTYRHEVRNETDQLRTILLLQVKRPVRFPGSLASDFFYESARHSPFVKDGLKNLKVWSPK